MMEAQQADYQKTSKSKSDLFFEGVTDYVDLESDLPLTQIEFSVGDIRFKANAEGEISVNLDKNTYCGRIELEGLIEATRVIQSFYEAVAKERKTDE